MLPCKGGGGGKYRGIPRSNVLHAPKLRNTCFHRLSWKSRGGAGKKQDRKRKPRERGYTEKGGRKQLISLVSRLWEGRFLSTVERVESTQHGGPENGSS